MLFLGPRVRAKRVCRAAAEVLFGDPGGYQDRLRRISTLARNRELIGSPPGYLVH